jgi:hypothetical protein
MSAGVRYRDKVRASVAPRRLEARDQLSPDGDGAVRRADDGTTPRDWVRIVPRCLTRAGLEPVDIDAVVIACESDHLASALAVGALYR